MANEVTMTASLSFNKATVTNGAVAKSISNLTFNVTGSAYIEGVMAVPTASTAIPLGGVTAPHFAYFMNLDPTNFLRIRNGVSGADLIKLRAGEAAFVPLYDSAVPYAIADTATVNMEYLIVQL